MTKIEMFQIGGCVRDHLLGLKSKDIDFVVVAPSFEAMEAHVRSICTKVFEDKDGVPVGAAFHTLRGLHPTLGAVDFVWARIDGPSSDGRHPDWVKPGSLEDDQRRRDFTANSIAMLEDGTLVDPFGGAADIEAGVLRFVGRAEDRLREDALRAFRGVRFSITKGFTLTEDAAAFIAQMPDESFDAVSTERIREEMHKCFATASMRTMRVFMLEFPQPAEPGDRAGAVVQADHGVEVSSELSHPSEGGAASVSNTSETSKGGRPITESCGTLAAYRRHKRKGETPCAECRTAYNAAHRRYYAKRHGLTPRKRDE